MAYHQLRIAKIVQETPDARSFILEIPPDLADELELWHMTVFTGAGETMSASLAALIGNGSDLPAATQEALLYLDQSLNAGFRPGMGHVLPDRLFWAQSEHEAQGDASADSPATADDFSLPGHHTQH